MDKKLKVLFITYDNESNTNPVPLGMLYIASYIRKHGFDDITFYSQDVFHYPEEHLTEYLNNNHFNVIGIGFVAGYWQHKKILKICEAIKKSKSHALIVLGGQGASPIPEFYLRKTGANVVVSGEGERPFLEILNRLNNSVEIEGTKGISYIDWRGNCITNPPETPIQNLTVIPPPAFDLVPVEYYLNEKIGAYLINSTDRYLAMITGRGCPYKCLEGDTLIHTLEGKVRIKNLEGQQNIKVLTRTPITNEPIFANASIILKTQKNAKLLRVNFDDGSYIDCTPEHKFMAFNNGNQNKPTVEFEVEAQNLKPSQSVRAIKFYEGGQGYEYISWGRGKSKPYHRLVKEGELGRLLSRTEHIHHQDTDKKNNSPINLLVTSQGEHVSNFHPEVSNKMKMNNPMQNHDIAKRKGETTRQKIKRGEYTPFMCTEKGKEVIGRIAKKRALSDENPMKKLKFKKEINHKVISVERLSDKKDVYCMEVPGYDWFYANDVLVHNCNFCLNLEPGIRLRPMEDVIEEIKKYQKDYNLSYIAFWDELFMLSEKRVAEFHELIIKNSIKIRYWCTGRFNIVNSNILKMLKETGCQIIDYGIEQFDNFALQKMNKKLTEEQIVKGIELTQKHDIPIAFNIIFGNTGDTRESLKKSLALLDKYNTFDQLRVIRPVTPYPGTALYQTALDRKLLIGPEDFYEKHINVELPTCNFTNIPDDEFINLLHDANANIIKKYYSHLSEITLNQFKEVYLGKDLSFRGGRH